MSEPGLHWPTATLVAVVTAVAANLASYPSVESAMSSWYEAAVVKPDHELRGLTAEHFGATRTRFESYAQLRSLARGATLVQPPGGPRLTVEQVRGLARMGHVERVYDPLVSSSVAAALDADVDAAGEDEEIGAYAVVTDEDPDELVLLRGPRRAYLVDRRVTDRLGLGVGATE